MPIARDDSGGGGEKSVLIAVKAVPGAKRDQVVGRLGERLKVRISQPPEGGHTNKAICALLAAELGVGERSVAIVRGEASPEKTIRVEGLDAAAIEARWPA